MIRKFEIKNISYKKSLTLGQNKVEYNLHCKNTMLSNFQTFNLL